MRNDSKPGRCSALARAGLRPSRLFLIAMRSRSWNSIVLVPRLRRPAAVLEKVSDRTRLGGERYRVD